MYTGYIKYYFASFSTFERNFASFFVFTSKFLAFLNPSTELSFFFSYNPLPKLRFIVTMPPISITRGPTNLWLGFSIKKKKNGQFWDPIQAVYKKVSVGVRCLLHQISCTAGTALQHVKESICIHIHVKPRLGTAKFGLQRPAEL